MDDKERQFNVIFGRSAESKSWKNKKITWSELVNEFSKTRRTNETVEEYAAMPKNEKSKIKDGPGYVYGALKQDNGRRTKKNILSRSMVSLDMDNAPIGIWEKIKKEFNYKCLIYSTHTHTPEYPRFRLIIPLDRDVLPEEYGAISRMIASTLDKSMLIFDDTTYGFERVMYKPSTSKNGEYIFEVQEGEIIKADDILNMYPSGWQDVSYWPRSSRAKAELNKALKEQEDPLEKEGIIGAFCRTYTITDVIDEFLSDVYVPGKDDTRYTYAEGSTTGGVVVYDNKFSYSHHGTDPASNICCNAFDLVRIHKFGDNKNSLEDMIKFAAKDIDTQQQLFKERLSSAAEEFGSIQVDGNVEWVNKLKKSDKGNILNNNSNIQLIIENDKNIKGKIVFDEFRNRAYVVGKLPWKRPESKEYLIDEDITSLCIYIEKILNITVNETRLRNVLNACISGNAINPPKEYLNSLKWDGEKRIDTLLIDYFGADDSEYTRVVTRKWMCGAVARILNPGCKFDNMIVLIGDQGIGKSTFFKKLAKDWFCDSLKDIKGNQAIEKLLSSWIIEFGELEGFNKSESSLMKSFLSSQEDITRLAYAHNTEYFKRHCVFVGTTNEEEFLKDDTGNRRYWPINIKGKKGRLNPKDKKFEQVIDQLWAEAVYLYRDCSEKLYLNEEQEAMAKEARKGHKVIDVRQGIVEEFLDTLIPDNWYKLSFSDRINYTPKDFASNDDDTKQNEKKLQRRDKVCVLEIWCECLRKNKADIKQADSRIINSIMNNIEGWEKSKCSLRFGSAYGKQRAFVRKKDTR